MFVLHLFPGIFMKRFRIISLAILLAFGTATVVSASDENPGESALEGRPFWDHGFECVNDGHFPGGLCRSVEVKYRVWVRFVVKRGGPCQCGS
jgi:hypothetical protein